MDKNLKPNAFAQITGYGIRIALAMALLMALSMAAKAETSQVQLPSVSQLGYHPESHKQVVVYTHANSGTVSIVDTATGNVAATFALSKAKDYFGNAVECQGNNPCLVADITSLNTVGTYYAQASNGLRSAQFNIEQGIFSKHMPTLLEFFNAMLQQKSAYHADMHSGYLPPFPAIADGSYILEADQASLSLIRLGSAYRRNPSIFQFDNYNIIASDKPDLQEYILTYVRYLQNLQGLKIQQKTDGTGFRIGHGIQIENAFVPGPTNLNSIDVYIPGNPPQFLQTVAVVSLCGSSDGSSAWKKCINEAALYYKCQIDEPCLSLKYIDLTGSVESTGHGFGISKGWGYEFGCYFDVDITGGNFNGQIDPCMVFHPETSRSSTIKALLGFLEALPAVHDFDPQEARQLFNWALQTYTFIRNPPVELKFPDESSSIANKDDNAFLGAALFLLYDYTLNPNYLVEAYYIRGLVSTELISDMTRGNEFYWEEYVRHKDAIMAAGLQYKVNGQDAEEIFRGKIFHDYKDAGPTSISRNAERIFQFNNDIPFQNSRYILTEGVIAAKTTELHASPEMFIANVADNQLAWLTGMNAVQKGVALNSSTYSISFIFGIGNFPMQFHSRYIVDTTFRSASQGSIIGARGTGYSFLDTFTKNVTMQTAMPSDYVFFDGKSTILSNTLGALGNKWRNETETQTFVIGKLFKNGKNFIPGWINGAFDTPSDDDIIFNYRDSFQTYEYTETTNEMVATAVELMSFLDARLNGKTRFPPIIFNSSNSTTSPSIPNASLNITTNPSGSLVYLNSSLKGTSDDIGSIFIGNLAASSYNLLVRKANHSDFNSTYFLQPGQTLSISVSLVLLFNSTPANSTPPGQNFSNSSNLSAEIVSSSTNATRLSSGLYHIFETATALFQLTLNSTGSVAWYADETLLLSTEGTNHSLIWHPGILYTSNNNITTIQARTGNAAQSWIVNVENVINPFFSGELGSQEAEIYVFTNNRIVNFSRLEAVIQSDGGGTQSTNTFQLSPSIFPNEVEWRRTIVDMPYGNSYMTQIIGTSGNISVTYTLNGIRAHYRSVPIQESQQNNDDDSGDNSGESPYYPSIPGISVLKLIYVTLASDVVSINETQEVTLDAQNTYGNVSAVEVAFRQPDGMFRTERLTKTAGSASYSTWHAEFGDFMQGMYNLTYVFVYGDGKTPSQFIVMNRSFYAADSSAGNGSSLTLVYSVLDRNVVRLGTNVTLRMDARDDIGIIFASANVTAISPDGGEEIFPVQLRMVSGSRQYGTWETRFIAGKPDTTYSVDSITLSNIDGSRSYQLSDRSVYVEALPKTRDESTQDFAQVTTALSPAEYARRILSRPLAPTILGFIVASVILLGIYFKDSIAGMFGQRRSPG